MFVLDTNVLSAIMGPVPAPSVARWMGTQAKTLLFTTAVSQAEIFAGLAIMPSGRKRRTLQEAAAAVFARDFEGRVLSFDSAAALLYGDIMASRRRAGRPIATADLMIAAIAGSRQAAVVTRDEGGFEGCGIPVVNPWTHSTTA